MRLTVIELALRLCLAAALGAVVGIERERASQGAGVRTHALVSLGAALFTIAGAYGFSDLARTPTIDPARVAAQVAAGVGFIGAGAIIRHGSTVVGVTTASTVWLAASIGLAAGAGGYAAAMMATVLAIILLVALRAAKPLTQRLGRHHTVVEVDYDRGHGTLGPVLRALEELDARVQGLTVDDDDPDAAGEGRRHVTLHVSVRSIDDLDHMIDQIRTRPEIHSIRVAGGGAT